ncbi:MAG: hypothetical protein HYZ36_07005, partial [Pedosphaera parvula]|nr:hypothetical protein [Pedosphaera parvula]
MKRFFAVALLLVLTLTLVLRAETADEMFVRYYQAMQSAENLLGEGKEQAALNQFLEAETGLKNLQTAFPQWNSKIIQYRLRYVADKIKPLAAKFPQQVREAQKATPPPKKAGPAGPMDSELSRLNEQMIDLRIEKATLEKKLAEALAARPAAIDPKELAKAEDQIKELRKANDLLKVAVEQDQQKMAKLVDASVVEETRKQLSEVNKQLAANTTKVAALTKDNESLQKKLQTAGKNSELLAMRSENSTLKQQVADLGKKATLVAKLESSLQETRDQNAALKREATALKETLKQDQRRTAKMIEASAVDAMKKDLGEVNRRLADQAAELGKAEKKNEKLTQELAALNQANNSLTQDNASLKNSLKDEQRKAAKMTAGDAASDALKKELADARRAAEQQKEQAAMAKEEAVKARDNAVAAQQQEANAKRTIEEVQQQVAGLRAENKKLQD